MQPCSSHRSPGRQSSLVDLRLRRPRTSPQGCAGLGCLSDRGEGRLGGRHTAAPAPLVPETWQVLSKDFPPRAGSGLTWCQAPLYLNGLTTEMAQGRGPRAYWGRDMHSAWEYFEPGRRPRLLHTGPPGLGEPWRAQLSLTNALCLPACFSADRAERHGQASPMSLGRGEHPTPSASSYSPRPRDSGVP